MKRLLVWLTLIAMLLTAAPMASAGRNPAVYTDADVMTAVSGMGRMPSNYYNLAGMALDSMDNLSAAQYETFTKKLYTIWAFLSKYAYTYNGKKAIKDVLAPAQWSTVSAYASKLAYDYGTPALYQLLTTFMSSSKATSLVKPGVARSLLGIRFDKAELGTPATVKVYTTTDVTGGVYLTDASGTPISDTPSPIPYAGTLATFNEFILTVDYPSAGKIAVHVCGVDAEHPENFFSTKAAVTNPADTGANGTTSASVTKVSANAVALGTPNTITVTTSAAATNVKLTDKKGVLLASSDEYTSPSATSKTFTIKYCFPSSGVQSVRVYAGSLSGTTLHWNKNYKTLNVSVATAAAKATISKITATTPLRGQAAKITVYASSDVTRVQLLDGNGDLVGFTRSFMPSGKLRVFELSYLKTAAGSYKPSVQVGNDIDWNSAKKSVTVKFAAPAITKVTTVKGKAGSTPATITVKASVTVTSVELYNSGKALQLTQTTRDANGDFVFSWPQSTKGTKTIYLKGYDAYGATAYFKSSVTFN